MLLSLITLNKYADAEECKDGQQELIIGLKYYLWRDAKFCGGDGGGVVPAKMQS